MRIPFKSRRARRTKTRRSGFNLVEMSIALVVVAIGIMSVAAIFPDQLEAVRKTADRAYMGQFAQSVDSVLRAVAAAGGDIGNIAVPGFAANTITLPPVGGGTWTSAATAGGTSPPAAITLDVLNTQLPSNPGNYPTPDVAKGGGLKFVDIADGNYVNQSLWYHIHVQPLNAADADGHRVIIYLWRSDGVTAPVDNTTSPASAIAPTERYITEIYKF